MRLFLTLLLSGLCLSAVAENKTNIIALHTDNLSLVMEVDAKGVLQHRYFGQKLSEPEVFLSKAIYRTSEYGTRAEAYSSAGGKNFREPALRVTHFDGDLNTELVFKKMERKDDAKAGTENLTITLVDKKYPLEVRLLYKAYKAENVFTMNTEIANNEKGDVVLYNYYSFYMPVEAFSYYLTHFNGTATTEMGVTETPLSQGMISVQSRKGLRSTHAENPSFLVSLDAPIQENSGNVIAGALAWGGNFRLNFEVDEFNTLNITAGINPYESEYHLEAGKSFETPEMIFTFSSEGAGQASRNMHDWARKDGLYAPAMVRPIVLNSWEGVYFNFNEKILKEMIDKAAELGVETFVLDDGWFGNKFPRNDATMGLGDWQVNKKKLPGGIDAIAKYAVSKGIGFGIWIEPEMVNPQSELAQKHPEWVVRANGREATTQRNQWVLDLSNPEVQDYVVDVFDYVIKLSKDISYIKWDANRHVDSVGSEYLPDDRQSHFWVEYTKGLYSVYERVREKHPDVSIQVCSSGGGRVEYGSLRYHQDFWASDNTDAYSRAFIQYGSNFIYPAIATGAHYSQIPNRHTKRLIPSKFRMDMAMTGRLGFELKLQELSNDDAENLKSAIKEYKGIRDIIQFGDLYRIMSPYDKAGYYSLMYVSKDKKRAVFYAFSLDYHGYLATVNFKLNGLKPDLKYKIKALNEPDCKFWANCKTISGDFLMKAGLNPNIKNVYQSAVYYLEATE